MCDRQCFPPPSNGNAVCAGAAGCDIECNANSLRCGNNCCSPPPANAIATCSGTQCGVRCRTGYHACEGTSSPCYVDSDVQRCGTGCVDCRQLNAVARCDGTRCDNVCEGFKFACTETSGKVGCGVWDFESRSLENWFVDTNSPLTDAWSGTLASNTTRSFTGTASLALGFNGNGMTSGTSARHAIELATKLCPSGGLVPWPAGRFVFAYLYVPSAGSGPVSRAEVYWRVRNGNQQLFAGCDVSLTASSSWQTAECNFKLDPPVSASIIGLVFRVFDAWQGTIYLDSIAIQ
jgi:hypothetical protein